ncbi:putative Pre mRNA splicing factor SF3A3 of SF3a complex Prp9 Domain of unknown function (DUF3449) [Trypanosoma vivax]|uniref:Putative splicing factor 3a n=1 Tax=Trypanosoma vivax (strain Y486) TaxID=1055687 RepID=G0TWY5_TRYVY|nr:putative splicing factor 3a [Trypanosoma vivax]KAH8614214.1 putative Pre mRNA splicing factor SF3A3 of SF3a complex Prp9 Domain of unknown function (DUF3449) [Trypanosoma vivax]CCC48474.1 putative splicing factor 3a [Trypanosoma vivax Y486]
MFGGILEKIRIFESDIERHIDNIVQQQLLEGITNPRHRILRDNFIYQQAEAIRPIADKLLDLYLDQDDIVAAQEAPAEGEDVLNAAMKEFEAQIADIREYHRTFRDIPSVKSDLDHPDPTVLDDLFTLAERYGSCLDLESHYHRYSDFMATTIKRAQEGGGSLGSAWPGRVEYFTFVPSIPNIILHDLDPHRKVFGFSHYKEFVEKLLDYLVHFYRRVFLMEEDVLNSALAKLDVDVEEYWSKLLEHKKALTVGSSGSTALTVLGTSGKLSSSLTVPPPLRKHVKTFPLWPISYVESLEKDREFEPPSLAQVKSVIHSEGKVVMLLQTLLFENLQETERVLLRDYSKTAEELEWERSHLHKEFIRSVEESRRKCSTSVEGSVAHAAQYEVLSTLTEPAGGADSGSGTVVGASGKKEKKDGDESEQLLDRDGKPVARWLVHLQQLHKKFYCEVCGGTVYVGPKAFREHFGAERHAEGLRRLGVIIHLKDFEGISSIRKVIEMRDRVAGGNSGLRKRIRADQDDEEMQDAQGNLITSGEYRRFQMSRRGI